MAAVTQPLALLRGAFLVATVATGLSLAPLAAVAEEDSDADRRARAKELLDRGDEQLRRGNALREQGRADEAISEYESALATYRAAYDEFPEPRIYYPIARAEENLGRYLDAHRHYQLLLDEADELSDRLRADVERRQEAVRERIGALVIQADPPGARVAIDGVDAGRGPFREPIFVSPGQHTLEISAGNHRSRRLDLEVEESEAVRVVVALEPIPELDDGLEELVELEASGEAPSASKTPLIAGVTLTAGLGLAATVTGLFAVSQHGTFSDAARPADERRAARDSGQIFAVTTDVLLVATAAAAGYTAYYYYGVYRPYDGETRARGEASRQSRPLWLAPYYAGDEGGGIAVGGAF